MKSQQPLVVQLDVEQSHALPLNQSKYGFAAFFAASIFSSIREISFWILVL
jgi:hypothetical protein